MTVQPLQASPVVIIGAGRSGTNMLRDVLTRLDGITTWPCDEINYIWRHGNRNYPTDELQREQATPEVVTFIRGQFQSFIKSTSSKSHEPENRVVLEKTCANALRVPFVDAVLPEARYIHLVRDGRDVVSSALQRWKAPLDIPYLAAKAKYVPRSDLPYYASRYFVNRFTKLVSKQSALSVWGPRFDGMAVLAEQVSLPEVCATQWVECVDSATRAFSEMPDHKVFYLRYEDFVSNPAVNLQSIAQFLSLSHTPEEIQKACQIVRSSSVGKGMSSGGLDLGKALAVMEGTLSAHGYSD